MTTRRDFRRIFGVNSGVDGIKNKIARWLFVQRTQKDFCFGVVISGTTNRSSAFYRQTQTTFNGHEK